MKTIQVDSGREWRGGQRQVLLLSEGLSARGIDSQLVCPPGSQLAERAKLAGVSVVELPLNGPWDMAAVRALRARVKQHKPDVIHAHTAHAVTTVGLACLGLSRPLRVAARRVDFRPSSAGVLKLRLLSQRVIAVSKAVSDVCVAAGVPAAQIRVVHSGIDPTLPSPGGADLHERLGLDRQQRIVGTIGELTDHKDHATLVQAAQQICQTHPNVCFVIVGGGELRAKLEAQIHSLGLVGRVLLVGFQEQVSAYLEAFEIFVMSSKLEGLGTSVLDAMARRLPVVATRTGGLPEMIQHEKTGLLVEPERPDSLAQAIGRLLNDKQLAAELAEAGLNRMRRSFSADSMVEQTLAIYRDLCTTNGARQA